MMEYQLLLLRIKVYSIMILSGDLCLLVNSQYRSIYSLRENSGWEDTLLNTMAIGIGAVIFKS